MAGVIVLAGNPAGRPAAATAGSARLDGAAAADRTDR